MFYCNILGSTNELYLNKVFSVIPTFIFWFRWNQYKTLNPHTIELKFFSFMKIGARRPYVFLWYSMEQSPSWEANRFAASQEFPLILWAPKVHYCNHKCPSPVSILSHLDPVHTPTSHFLKIHLTKSHVPLSLLTAYRSVSPGLRLCLWIQDVYKLSEGFVTP
jgi:hypothetical protein